jgi:HKD family nuclease
MELLSSNFSPLKITDSNFTSRWEELFATSAEVRVAVGYVSNDSLLHLSKLLELNEPKRLEVCIGMAFFDGLTRSQFEAIELLNQRLQLDNLGELRIVRVFPFHGKVYEFSSSENINTYLVGSSNLSNVVPIKGIQTRNYELDLEISEPRIGLELNELITGLINECSVPFESVKNQLKIREDSNLPLDNRTDVERIEKAKLIQIMGHRSNNSFEIPLKDAPKSNLNVYFGEGRIDKQNFIKPRHWYEVEIIVDLSIQKSAKNYPANVDFIVYTDDGFRFPMRTSGDYGKNMRSRDDLTILGRWIKGRMETASALKSGELVKVSNFEKYGRASITFTETSLTESDIESGEDLKVWLIDFSPRNLME